MFRFCAISPDCLLRRASLLVVSLLLYACSDDNSLRPEESSRQIVMSVQSDEMQASRALVEEDTDLQTACDPDGGGEAIGIWSSYELDGQKVHHVLGNPTGDVSLIYSADTEYDNYKGWTYGEEAVFWTPGAKYTFNAYYPKEAVDEISSSNESTFVVEYNTEHDQKDLMVAYAFADTAAPDFSASVPVQLNMLHALSAVKFQFLFMNSDNSTYEDQDLLTACWLENTVSQTGLATTGVLAFGTIADDGSVLGETIRWYEEDYPEPSTPTTPRRIYVWEDAAGVAFSSTTSSYKAAISHSTRDALYSSNEGWILIIPQQTDATTQLCFKLGSTGDLVHRIPLPTATYEAGKRYVYNVRMGQSGVSLTLKIADWNELKSSHNIAL